MRGKDIARLLQTKREDVVELDTIKHIGAPASIEKIDPDMGHDLTTPNKNPVLALLESIDRSLAFLAVSSDDTHDGMYPIMRELTAGVAGFLTIEVPHDLPYFLISGIGGGVPRNLTVYRGAARAYPLANIPKGGVGQFTVPFTQTVTIDYDVNATKDELYIYLSARPIAADNASASTTRVAASLLAVEGVALASAARTSSVQSSDIIVPGHRGIALYLSVTTASGTGGLSVTVQGKDPLSGLYANINTPPPAIIAATGATPAYYLIALGASGGAAVQATSAEIPRTIRVNVTAGDATNYVYGVGYALLP